MSYRNGSAPDYGDMVEQWACRQFGWEHADETWYDHRGTEVGRPMQTKGAMVGFLNGTQNGKQLYNRGRFRLWEDDHESLVENDGAYLFVVYREDEGNIDVEAWKILSPADVEDAVDWYDGQRSSVRSKGRSTRLGWYKIFDEDEVDDDR
jgi:hypothetical protein